MDWRERLYWELQGVLIDISNHGYDPVCGMTIKRVSEELMEKATEAKMTGNQQP